MSLQLVKNMLGFSLSIIALVLFISLLTMMLLRSRKTTYSETQQPEPFIFSRNVQNSSALGKVTDDIISNTNAGEEGVRDHSDNFERFDVGDVAYGNNFARSEDVVEGVFPVSQGTNAKVVIRDDDIVNTHTNLLVHQLKSGIVICDDNVCLPEPYEFEFSNIGEIVTFHMFNRNENVDVELGYGSKWISKCETTTLPRLGGSTFCLRYIGNTKAEIYNISI